MPQIFQVLKCYKCFIFQVHQARKDNKWKCKVCGEKQSVKRHHGTGTAKDCRVHVQKLNCLQGDITESKLKAIQTDSSNSDCEDNTDVDEIPMKNTQKNNHYKKESKWSAYIEKEEISAVNEPDFIGNVEVCLELPQRRKCKQFKVPKLSNNTDCDQKTEIMNEIINKLPAFDSAQSNSFKSRNKPTELLSENTEINKLELSENKSKDFNKNVFHQINKHSKWAHYVSEEENENDICNESLEKEDFKDENMDYCFHGEEERITVSKDDCHQSDQIIRKSGKVAKTSHKSMKVAPIFLISDDNDLDNILDF